ncbi:cytidine deaminase [Spizellomyces punctatus DAOM BR117]|uniref:Cytidine deaminase n=1 Tax=Spizellomyces punctatus (strain DAOM BR117) TaxID=645134 RepID=A0A0L0HE83_SPIPD|nr:cytidine deaminase [Spizellomyces punctatus DAOM BR117]KNC99331.1 cytidine deaminase [Spizellomyces punctatus DAOM BR117]|eukprot:XP_016607371.1 cytidine deaminase [Spizellomyces punctatus DAOM BR117]
MSVQAISSPNARVPTDVLKKVLESGELTQDLEKRLFELASVAKTRSYSPYSKFRVGAAVLAKSGNIWLGCNVESASYGATRCAEQTAFLKAVSDGDNRFIAVGVTTDTDAYISPCGICRQFMVEWGKELLVYNFKPDGSFRKYKLKDLLPDSFGPDDLDRPREGI